MLELGADIADLRNTSPNMDIISLGYQQRALAMLQLLTPYISEPDVGTGQLWPPVRPLEVNIPGLHLAFISKYRRPMLLGFEVL